MRRSSSVEITIVRSDDWYGAYLNGELVYQDHNLDLVLEEVFLELDIPLNQGHANADWLSYYGILPENIVNVVWEGEEWENPDEEV